MNFSSKKIRRMRRIGPTLLLHRKTAIVLVFLFAGCTTTYKLGTPDELKRRNGNHPAFVHLNDGGELRGKDLHAEKDSIRFIDRGSDSSVCLPLRDVRCVEHIDRLSGAIFGFFMGMLGGGATGVCVAGAMNPQGGEMAGFGLLGGAIVGGAIGATGGLVWGAVHGIRARYEFPVDSIRTEPQKNPEPAK